MIKSMTGFGRAEVYEGERKFTVEIKAVNHRYLDFFIRMPKKLNFFEASIRNELKNHMQRGKIDVYIGYEDFTEANVCIKYNKELAAEYMHHLKQISEDFGLDYDIRTSTLSRYPEVITMEEQTIDEEELWSLLKKAIDNAVAQFVESRIKEGETLRNDILSKLNNMITNINHITERAPSIMAEYHQKLKERGKCFPTPQDHYLQGTRGQPPSLGH